VGKLKASDFLKYFAVGVLCIFLSVSVHEMTHVLVAISQGCKAGIQELSWMYGATGVGEKCPNEAMVKIAISAPIVSFLIGLFLWFWFGKDSEARLVAISLFVWSVLPNTLPLKELPTDFSKAVEFGLPLWVAWTIHLFFTGIIFYLFSREVMEKE
jgi:hypothetical protein